jgi:hypothetical protein
MRHLKLSRLIMTVALLLVGLLFYSRVHAITVPFTPATQHVLAKMWPVFSSYDDDDGEDDDDGDDGDDDDGDD